MDPRDEAQDSSPASRPPIASHPSWNPALRPERDEPTSPAVDAKPVEPEAVPLPEPTPAEPASEAPAFPEQSLEQEPYAAEESKEEQVKEQKEEHEIAEAESQQDEPAAEVEEAPAVQSPPRAPNVLGRMTITDTVPQLDDDFFDREPSADGVDESFQKSPERAPAPDTTMKEEDIPGTEAQNQAPEKDDQWGGDDADDFFAWPKAEPKKEEPAQEEPAPASEMVEQPADHYEHQGVATTLEAAISDSPEVPLVPAADTTGDEWGPSGEDFDLGGLAKDEAAPTQKEEGLPTPQAEAVGTNVGDGVIGDTTIGGNAGEDDWGTTSEDPFATEIAPVQEATGGDSAWDLALDDDLLLDDDFLDDTGDAPVLDLDDGEGFLEDTLATTEQSAPAAPSTTNRYAPQAAPAAAPTASPYAPQKSQFTDFSQLGQKNVVPPASVATYGAYGQPTPYQQPAARPELQSTAQSFVDKSKGGYHSPYDLPDDVIAHRKRAAPRPVVGPLGQPAQPPARSSSMYSNAAHVPPQPPMAGASPKPPTSSHSNQAAMSGLPPKPPSAKPPSTEFFAELPITTKPKPAGRYTPVSQQSPTLPGPPQAHAPPPQGPPQAPPQVPPLGPSQATPKERTGSWSSPRNEVLPDGNNLTLRGPEPLPVFPAQPSVPVRANTLPIPAPAPAVPSRYSPQPPAASPTVPSANARYSPAPPVPAAASRYSPVPPPQPPAHNRYTSDPATGLPKPPVQPYAPRTSSPLAYPSHTHELDMAPIAPVRSHPLAAQPIEAQSQEPPHEHLQEPHDEVRQAPEEVQEAPQAAPASAPQHEVRAETPPVPSQPGSAMTSPRKSASFSRYQPGPPSMASSMLSPGRNQSLSPESMVKQPLQRQVSSERPPLSYGQPAPVVAGLGIEHGTNVIPHKRTVSHDFSFIAPQDERSVDPLERWKGYPIFKWGMGGTVVSSFPKQIPRYGGGASMPMMKCAPGEVKIQNAKEILPLDEHITKFPGPLKAKGKKKEVLAWLAKGIESQEARLKTPGFEHSVDAETLKRTEEKLLLWKILQVLVENDGHLEGNAAAEAAVRKVLAPDGLINNNIIEGPVPTAADLVGGVGRPRTNSTAVLAEPIDPKALEELRSLLTQGDREKAVWHAVDQRLWAHAMLLSSTLNKDIWKQVVQEFVRKEVKKVGPNNQALAVLYEVFAGNWEDCIDELVPPSARAGFQMVSAAGGGPTENALQGLDKWRETLSLILNNRSTGDTAALLSLGRLLAGYGRADAAHICFIFARSVAVLGGVDDPQADVVLLGADHRSNPLSIGSEPESTLLTEVYEFALSLAAPTGVHVIPHLQSYKLAHAINLAEYGFRSEAQAYCDALATTMKATTKVSPYYNGSFIATLDDLTKRLSQAPKDGSSWISKPSMDKVSSSLLSKFNSFIAGDDEDAASNHSGAAAGPFARIAGTPTISPSQSSADLYGAYSGMSAPVPIPSNSRYAPRSSMEQGYPARTSLDQGRTSYEPQGRPSIESVGSNPYMPPSSLGSPYTPSQFSPNMQRQEKSQTYAPLKSPNAANYGMPYQPTPPTEHTPNFGGYMPTPPAQDSRQPSNSYEPPAAAGGYEPPTSSYEPPAAGGYEPPTAEWKPYEPEPDADSDSENTKKLAPKKKGIMDLSDDEDSAAAERARKAEADRKADEAFRKAAEEDAKRDNKNQPDLQKKSSWFGSWFKKDPNAPQSGPIKAKLGEENSFVYDPELKKWVNKKAGASGAETKSATPPPPRMGPPSGAPRSVSDIGGGAGAGAGVGANGPPSAPPSVRPGPSNLQPPTSNPRSSSMPPPMAGPPSRTTTPGTPGIPGTPGLGGSEGEGNGSKPPTPMLRPGMMPHAATTGPPSLAGSRPSTGMSNASSIDDLLGAPGPKKGTVRKKKGGARYVDVMAQK